MAHVAESKKKIVKEFSDLINSYPVIGIVDMENLPTAQLQKMRVQLRDKVLIKMTKRRLINLILDNTKEKKKGIEEMKNYLTGMPALLFTKDDPFILAKTLKKSMSTAPAKPGQVAPKDIIVTAGPTAFSPGPVISELASAGIKTAIENGKIVVKSDTVVVKKGEKVSQAIAGILTRLGVEPMEVGLNLTAVYDNGAIFTRDVLDIDEEEFMSKIKTAYNSALGLALELSFLTKETTEMMIAKAFRDSKTIALSQNIMADDIKEEIMAKANKEMLSLKSKLNIPDAPKEESKDKPEEKVEEVVKEEKEIEEKPEEIKEKSAEEKKKEIEEVSEKEEEPEKIKEPEEKPKQEKSEDRKKEVKEEVKKEEQKAEVKAEDIKEETKAEKPKEEEKQKEEAKSDDTKEKPEEQKAEVKDEVTGKVEEVEETSKEEVPSTEQSEKVEKKEEINEPEEKSEEKKEEIKKEEQKEEVKAEKPEEEVKTKENQDKQN